MTSEILDLAREFALAAQRFNDALPTVRAGGPGSVWCVTADQAPLPPGVRDELVTLLSTVTWDLCQGIVYTERTSTAHGDREGAEALRGMHGLLAHLAFTLKQTATENTDRPETASEGDIRAIAENVLSTAAANAEHAPGYPASWHLLNEADLIHTARPLSAMESEEAEEAAYRQATRLAASTLGQVLASAGSGEAVGETLRRAAALLQP